MYATLKYKPSLLNTLPANQFSNAQEFSYKLHLWNKEKWRYKYEVHVFIKMADA